MPDRKCSFRKRDRQPLLTQEGGNQENKSSSLPLLWPSDLLLVTKLHYQDREQGYQLSWPTCANLPDWHRAGKGREGWKAYLALKSQWNTPLVLASRTAKLRSAPKSRISHFFGFQKEVLASGPGCLRVAQLLPIANPESEPWSDIRWCLSTAGIVTLAEIRGALETWRDPQWDTASCMCYCSDPSPDPLRIENSLHCLIR